MDDKPSEKEIIVMVQEMKLQDLEDSSQQVKHRLPLL